MLLSDEISSKTKTLPFDETNNKLKEALYLKIPFGEYSFIMNKHNQKPTDMFNKQYVTVFLTCIKILKY